MLRLTIINQFYTPDFSPTAHLAASLADHRAARGDHVTMLTSRAGYAAALVRRTAQSTNGVQVRRLWSTHFGSRTRLGRFLDWATFYLPAFWAAATMPRQDVVISMTTPPLISLAAWVHKLLHPSARLILWNMDVYPEALERTSLIRHGSIVSRFMRSAHRALFRRLDHLVCLDQAMANLLLSQYMPPDRQVRHSIIPNWEPLALFPDGQIQPRRHEVLTILYLGNAGFGHEFQTLIDTADKLKHQPVKFLFIGGGILRPWIKNAVKQRQLTNIELRDYVPKEQTPAVMREADFALITLENSMLGVMSPSKLHANLAMGLPILYVGPAGSNVDHAIATYKCGISLRPGQSRELAEIILRMLNVPAEHLELKHHARQAFEAAYCDGKTLPMFDAIIDGPGE